MVHPIIYRLSTCFNHPFGGLSDFFFHPQYPRNGNPAPMIFYGMARRSRTSRQGAVLQNFRARLRSVHLGYMIDMVESQGLCIQWIYLYVLHNEYMYL